MDRPGTFIMSFDCEGKWGMADCLQSCHKLLTDEAIVRAYERILALLARYDVQATFAFVMALTLTRDEQSRFDSILKRRPGQPDAWLEHYWQAVESGDDQGWHSPDGFALVRNAPGHEIACHSFCHRPLGAHTSAEDAETEIGAAVEAGRLKGVTLSTFVFPRNEIGNLGVLRRHGFIGYRGRLRRPRGLHGRALSFAAEFNVRPRPQEPRPAESGLVPVPSGYFFNWRFGPRRLVPPQVTVARWRNLLRRTSRSAGVAHLWLHPHNLITAPSTGDVLERVLAAVAEARQRGEIRIETLDTYCRRMLSEWETG